MTDPTTATTGRPLLILGYGSTLHGDDALGPRIAAAVGDWGRPGIKALIRHELVPELAADIAEAGRVIFVDADAVGAEVSLQPVVPAKQGGGIGHALTPPGLLALSEQAYGRCPPSELLAVPGEDFGLGENLSARALRNEAEALDRLRKLV